MIIDNNNDNIKNSAKKFRYKVYSHTHFLKWIREQLRKMDHIARKLMMTYALQLRANSDRFMCPEKNEVKD